MQTIERELDMAYSIFGALSPALRRRLRAYHAQQNVDTWDDVHCVLLTPCLTVWQAWLAVCPDAPKRGRSTDDRGCIIRDWQRIPTRREFEAAIEYATH